MLAKMSGPATDAGRADETFQETQASVEVKADILPIARKGKFDAHCLGITEEKRRESTPCLLKALRSPISVSYTHLVVVMPRSLLVTMRLAI